MDNRTLLPLLAVLALSACVSTHAIQLGTPGQYAPVDPSQVQVFLAEADVQVPFDKVALIEAEGDYDSVDKEKLLNAMKKKAGKLGANAIILGEFKDPSVVSMITKEVLGVGGKRKANVVAIRLRP